MTKITIEIDGQGSPAVSQATDGAAAPAPATAPMATAAPESGSLAALLQRAAAIGAINAGPAPSLDNAQGSGPAAFFDSGSAYPSADAPSTSAGSAPANVFSTMGS
jgi:hypothetical protein